MKSRGRLKSLARFAASLLLGVVSNIASAEIIDDIRIRTDANGEVDALVKFTVPVQQLRYFPQKKSQYLVVYFNILDTVPRDQWQDYDSQRSPPSDIITGFSVSTRDLNTGPRIDIKFARPVEYTLKAGKDGRSLYLHIKTGLPPKQEAQPPAATPPAAPALPQLGAREGLPPFPAIDQAAMDAANIQLSDTPTLAEQTRKTDGQAAVLMAKGRDALLAGQMFAAIEPFNEVLKLPPNRYSSDAQVWIGIAREKSGQQAKALLEYDSYLKLYPDGSNAAWVRQRMARLSALQPPAPAPVPQAAVPVTGSPYQTSEYGSLSMYYYHGASHTDTITTVGNVQTPSSLTVTDQSSLITNVSMTARTYNDTFDDRLVFQDFYSANFLPNQPENNRLNALYADIRNRPSDYSVRIGRQSAMGGGVLGRFDGISAGAGFQQSWRVNVVAGQLSDYQVGSKPRFSGASLDFGTHAQIGGTVYYIKQTVDGLIDRKAVGGNLRYFDPHRTAIATVDYDTQIRSLNMFTLQGTWIGDSTDYNFLLDRRKSPSLSLRNSVNGAFGVTILTDANGNLILDANNNPIQVNFVPTVSSLLQAGFTEADLARLADQRTVVSNVAQVGMTNHIDEKWQAGTDIAVSNTSGLAASGTLNPDGTTGLEGFVQAIPATGNTWTLTERLIGNEVITRHDITIFSLSYTTSPFIKGTTLFGNNHAPLSDRWTVDTTLRFYWQTDNTGGRESIISPVLKLGYQVKDNLVVETEGGIEQTRATPSTLQSSTTRRNYISLGFRWDF